MMAGMLKDRRRSSRKKAEESKGKKEVLLEILGKKRNDIRSIE